MTIRSVPLRQNPAYRPGTSHPRRWWLIAALSLAACRARVPEQVISQPKPELVPPDEIPRSWIPQPGSIARVYHIEQRALVVTTADSGGATTDSTSLTVDASVRNVAVSGIGGLVLSVSAGALGARPAPIAGLLLPYAFTAPAPPPGTQLLPVGHVGTPDPCVSPVDAALGPLRDILMRLPDSLYLGQTWSDSGAFVTCRDGVRIDVTSRREFKVIGYERRGDAGVLLVARSASTVLRGLSVRGDDTTRLEGHGITNMRYEIDSSTGDVIAASGPGLMQILVRGTVKSQEARQMSVVLISRRVP